MGETQVYYVLGTLLLVWCASCKGSLPTGFNLSSTTDSLTVSWTTPDTGGVPDAFTVKIGTSSVTLCNSTASSSSCTANNLKPGSRYTIQVTNSTDQIVANDTYYTGLDAASPALVNITSREMTISWRDPENTDVSHYIVYTTTKGGTKGTEHKVESSSSKTYTYTFTGLVPGETYVTTVIVYSTGQQTNAANRTDTTHPLDVSTFSANTTHTESVQLSWTVSSESKQDGFKITYNGDVEIDESTTSGQTNYVKTISNLTPGVTYTFTMSPYSLDNQKTKIFSQTSKEAKETTVPLAPTNVMLTLSVTAPTTTLVASWSAPDKNDNGVKYKARLDKVTTPTCNGTEKDVNNPINSYTFNGLIPGAGYRVFVWVEAGDLTDTGKRSPVSKSTDVYTQPPKPNQPVRDLDKTTTDTLSINWTMPSSSGEYDSFKAAVPAKNIEVSASKDNMVANFSGLTAGTAYNVSVVSVVGNIVESTSSTTDNLYTKPNAPDSVQAAEQTNSSIMINWTRPQGGVARYKAKLNDGNAEDNNLQTTKTFSKLNAGTLYKITVYSETADGTQSAQVTRQYYTAPDLPGNVEENTTARTTTRVGVTWTAPATGRYDGYSIRINGSNQTSTLTNDTTHHEFDNVSPGSVYKVTLKATLSGLFSTEVVQQVTARPNPPISLALVANTNSTSSITFSWIAPSQTAPVDKYSYTVLGEDVAREIQNETSSLSATIQNLTPGATYNVSVNAIKNDAISQNTVLKGVTVVPEKPVNLLVSNKTTTSLYFHWDAPAEGSHPWYYVEWFKHQFNPDLLFAGNRTVNTTFYTISELDPGQIYKVTVYTVSNGVRSSGITEDINTLVDPSLPDLVRSNDSALTVTWNAPRDTDVSNYTVSINSSNTPNVIYDSTNGTNQQHTFSGLVPGQTYNVSITVYTTGNQKKEGHVIFITNPLPPTLTCQEIKDTSTQLVMQKPTGYLDKYIINYTCPKCANMHTNVSNVRTPEAVYLATNLKRAQTYNYTVKSVREASGHRPKESVVVTISCPTSNILMISVVSAAVGLAAIVILSAVVIVVRRRRNTVAKPRPADEQSANKLRGGRGTVVGRPVNIAEFVAYYHEMAADSSMKFSDEYQNLNNVGKDQPFEASQLVCNKPKNRYTNILPYDHSRVKLLPTDQEDGTTDYINANWMPGYTSKREFIACQGPLPGTVDDHWRMIWEYNCQAIVMLANCKEGKKDKCYHYWPHDREPMFYGDLEVQIVRKTKDTEHAQPHYIITYMKISQGEQVRQVIHFHYVVWPDFGVPEDPESLISFVKKVRSNLLCEGGPTVVHCSAGVGRTGTFIALDRVLQTIDEHDIVDIYSIVHEMRMNRPFMVQTEKQYIFIHRCLKHELESRGIGNDCFIAEGEEEESIYMNA